MVGGIDDGFVAIKYQSERIIGSSFERNIATVEARATHSQSIIGQSTTHTRYPQPMGTSDEGIIIRKSC